MSNFIGNNLPEPSEENEPRKTPDILPIGEIASRHLIAKTKNTDIYAKSIDQLSAEVSNEEELRYLISAVTKPYEALFLDQAERMPKKTKRIWSGEQHKYIKQGGWVYRSVTDNGLLHTAVKYSFEKNRKTGLKIYESDTIITGNNDAEASLGTLFNNNFIYYVDLTWKGGSSGVPKHPLTLVNNLKGTQLGEFIDLVIGPNQFPNEQDESSAGLVFAFGDKPQITASRQVRKYEKYKGDSEAKMWVYKYYSSFTYHPEVNAFIRHKGLGEINKADKITELSNGEFVTLLHELLSLIPTVNLGRPIT
jgi:hypothetical protein